MKHPFVISGMGRSGSSFLYMVLRDHPKIALTNEGKIIEVMQRSGELAAIPSPTVVNGVRGIVNADYVPLFSKLHAEHARRLLIDFYEQFFSDRQFTHWGDKLPNATATVYLRTLLPETKIILLARDPRDVVCSFRAFAKKMQTSPEDKEFYARDDHAASWLRQYELLTTLTDYHLLSYQGLVEAPEQTITAALRYLDLQMLSHCRKAIEANQIFTFHGTSKTPEQSLGRWRRELSTEEAAQIVDSCGEMMERLQLPR